MEKQTPRSLNYHMPEEWAKHDATWLSWPKNPLTFPDEVLGAVENIYVQMIAALSPGEKVKVLVNDDATADRVLKLLRGSGAALDNVELPRIKSSDVWIRDYGPTFLLNRDSGEKAAVKWRFNAWGGKYDDLMYDDVAGEDVVQSTGVRVFRPGIVLEGGSIDVNGRGTVLTTEQCLLNKNRNPQLSREEIEKYLEEYIGTPDVVWLKSGIEGDDTDGHVDDFARFVSSRTIVCAHSETGGGHNPEVLRTNLDILDRYRDSRGGELEVLKLPMPEPIPLPEEERMLPASYANFYIGNKVVLVPVFNDPADQGALEILEGCFPGREVVPIPARDLIYGYGGFHCVTQQEPAGRE
ncbi:agmatine deiminase family protein [Methanomassiliicoccus luminyensis]|uniref:agmatine deiminase family protein n=1 Tax=Methanomassiliicoccus luminyensis TaxID=1080712 RepID=UPI000B00550C|nr:agmatine deiminase family protein [Methanomassiliicoccus luminyensis]